MTRVLHIIPASPFGGAQRLAIDLAARQRTCGLDAMLVFTNPGEASLSAAAVAAVPVIASMHNVRTWLSRLQTARSILANDKFDIVHLHMPPPWFLAALPARRQFTLVTHLHVCPALPVHTPTVRQKLESILVATTLARSDILLPVSKWVGGAWRQVYPWLKVPMNVVYNGVEVSRDVNPRKAPHVQFAIGIACRLSKGKGLEEFLSLASRIRQLAPEARFRIAGDGPMKFDLEHRAHELGLSPVLEFSGFILDRARFWQEIDIAAFTAPLETFGLSLIEPLAYGVPVVAYYNNSGSDEVIAMCRGINAVRYGDIETLAGIAVELGRSPDRRAQIATVGQEDLVRHFSIDIMERNIRAAYHSALDRRASLSSTRAA